MKTYTLCGSMRFEKEMREVAYYLETQKGYSILQCVYIDLTSNQLRKNCRLLSRHIITR